MNPILFPTYDQLTNKFKWPKVVVKNSLGKGLGLFATEDLKSGMIIPFLGILLHRKEYVELWSKHSVGHYRLQYVMKQNKNIYVNGHPDLDLFYLFIASRVNEPSKYEQANSIVFYLGQEKMFLGLQLMEDIKKGEELLIHYGHLYYREYTVGKDYPLPDYDYISISDKDRDKLKYLLDVCNYKIYPIENK